jgi:hypothetical protein
LFGRFEHDSTELLDMGLPDPRCDSRGPSRFQRNQSRDAQLDRFFGHPREPLAVTGSDRESQLRLRRPPFRRSDLNQPLRTCSDQHSGPTQPSPIQHLDIFILAGSPDIEMVDFALAECRSLSDDRTAGRN